MTIPQPTAVRSGDFWHYSDGTVLPVVSGGAVVEPAASPAEAAPAAPPPEAPPAPVTLDDAGAAAEARARVLSGDPVETVVPDGAPYRDVVPVREQITKVREEFSPYAQAFGELDAGERAAALAFAPALPFTRNDPGLGADIGYLQAQYPHLPADEQAVLDQVLGGLKTDPPQARRLLADAAAILRGETPGTPATAPPVVDPDDEPTDEWGYKLSDPARPLTAKEADERFTAMLAEHETARETQRAEQQAYDTLLGEITNLGYDPRSTDPTKLAEFDTMWAMVRRTPPGPDQVAKAHAAVQARDQAIIDQYVQGLRGEHLRPQPPGGGAPPSGERVLEGLDDSERAAAERLARLGMGRQVPS